MPAHLQRQYGKAENETDPESTGHVDQFGARTFRNFGRFWFQSHTANRAVAGANLPDLRMHGAGVDNSFALYNRRCSLQLHDVVAVIVMMVIAMIMIVVMSVSVMFVRHVILPLDRVIVGDEIHHPGGHVVKVVAM